MDETGRLFEAIQKGNAREVSKLLEEDRALVDAKKSGVSALLTAVYHRHPEIARIFVEHGAMLDIVEASAVGDVERLRELLAEDSSRANAFAPDGFTPLGLAAFFGHPEAVRLLLENGADPNLASANAQRVAPLHSAVAGGNVEIVRELVAVGADTRARQELGFSPLHGAAAAGSEEMVRLLLAHGADRNARTDGGKTAAEIARDRGNERIVELLRTTEAAG
jgi:ankyrin repeat protein